MFCLPPEVNKSDDGLPYIEYDWLMAKIVPLFSSLFFTR